MRSFNVSNKDALNQQGDYDFKYAAIDILHDYIENPNVEFRSELLDIKKYSDSNFGEIINCYLKYISDNDMHYLLDIDTSNIIEFEGVDKYREFQESNDFKLYSQYVIPIRDAINFSATAFLISSITKLKENISYKNVLLKSISLVDKYLFNLRIKFKLSPETINRFAFGLLMNICDDAYYIFNYELASEEFKKLGELLARFNELQQFLSENKNNREIQAIIQKQIDELDSIIDDTREDIYKHVAGNFELIEIDKIKDNKTYFNFDEFKNLVKERFKNDINSDSNDNNENQLKYFLWLVHINTLKKTGENPLENRFILDNMLIPWSQELRELLGEDFDNTNFNIDEAINYIGRLRDKGEYKSQYYKIKALKKVFDYGITEGYNNNAQLVRLDMSRDYINSEASDIGLLMLNVLSQDGQVIKPYNFKGKEMYFVKEGPAISDEALNLFHYLIGEIEDNVPNTSEITGMKFYKTEFCKAMKKDLRGKKFYYIADLVRELQQVQYKIFTLEEYEKIKTSKRRAKAIPLFIYEEIDFNGDDIELNFNIPIVKYFRGLNRFARAINRDITSIMFSRPRIYKIARYAVMESFRNENDVLRKIDTLIESIGDSERFNNDSNKRRYLAKLKDDVERANSYLISGASIKMDKCNVGTKAEARVLISGTSKLALKNKNSKKR